MERVENWSVFTRDGLAFPMMIMIDQSFQEFPKNDFTNCVVLEFGFLEFDIATGYPSDNEYMLVIEMDEKFRKRFLVGRDTLFIGKSIFDKKRRLYFYTKDAPITTKILSAVMNDFPRYKYSIQVHEDTEWSKYEELLPNDRELQIIDNSNVLYNLQENGDLAHVARPIEHFFYFKTEKERDAFIDEIIVQGFKVLGTEQIKGRENSFSVHLKREDAVTEPEIHDLIFGLQDLAEKHLGEYDGWETYIVSSE